MNKHAVLPEVPMFEKYTGFRAQMRDAEGNSEPLRDMWEFHSERDGV